MDCIFIVAFIYTFKYPKHFTIDASHSPILTHTHTNSERLPWKGANQLVGSN
uniref:Uncharacterized protein n=1 Tax=Anguilla anguilla TaxID=7936 RepID=A0A0E9RCB6_ANGAN